MSSKLVNILFAGDSHVIGCPEIEGDVSVGGSPVALRFRPRWFGTAYEALDLIVTFPDGRQGLNPAFAQQLRNWPGLDVKGRPKGESAIVQKYLVLSFGTGLSPYDPAIDINDRKVERLIFPGHVDFVSPQRPELGVDSRCTLIPAALIEEMYDAILEPLRCALKLLHPEFGDRLFLAGSPPPTRDNAKRQRLLESRAKAIGLSEDIALPTAVVLLKTWLLVTDRVARLCEAEGCRFIPSLAALRDEQGYLRPAFEGDGIHGNPGYAEAMARHIVEVVLSSDNRRTPI